MARVARSAALITATREWRARAIQLAADHKLIGQARHTDDRNVYACISASEPDDHTVAFNPITGSLTCNCKAGENVQPCGHAGATLLLIVGCAPERARDAKGFTE